MPSHSRNEISRRRFLGGMAAVPLAIALRGENTGQPSRPRIAVIGAGAFGGWTALELARSGCDVVLLDAWGPGNPRSSSGGETRVIRAIYGADRIYVEMVKRSYTMWEGLIDASGEPLYVETGVLWLNRGSDAYVRSSLPIVRELGFPVEELTIEDAARRYPQIEFEGVDSVWLERRAGALSARRACSVVLEAFESAGGTFRLAHVELGPITKSLDSVRLGDGSRLEADVFVFACGPWLGKVFPDAIGDRVRATRQEVYYFGTPAGSRRYLPDRFPIWIDFGERIFYGIPDVHGSGFKVADDTRGELFDPTNGNRSAQTEGVERVRALLAQRFPELARAPLLKAEVCQYENSPDGHLIIDRHPAADNVWIVGGGSGHGFKLGPALGELTAGAILGKKEVPKMFQLARLQDTARPATQFEGSVGPA